MASTSPSDISRIRGLTSGMQVCAAARAAGATYPDDAGDDPKPEDRLFGIPVVVRDDGGAPHLELDG